MDFAQFDFDEPSEVEIAHDPKVDEAKKSLLRFFEQHPQEIFYEHQLEILFEKTYFHWIVGKALRELAEEGKVETEIMSLSGQVNIRFYRRRSHRNWRRQAERIMGLVRAFSTEDFARGLGRHGEQMYDAALPSAGFVPKGRNVRCLGARLWTQTDHDLDRIFERDGVVYGTEIKNRLSYMDLDEIKTKMKMCAELGIVPLFIVRMIPKSYFNYVFENGGITLITGYQLYPHGQHRFAEEVKAVLGLPVDCPPAIYEGTLQRLLKAHNRVRELRMGSTRGEEKT